jgi:hypothetical protein
MIAATQPTPRWQPRVVVWDTQPVLWRCLSAPVSFEQVEEAARIWHQQGAPLLSVYEGPCSLADALPWVIYVSDVRTMEQPYWPDDQLGLHIRFPSMPGDAGMGSEIHLATEEFSVLLHEIGHTWFFDHHPDRRHIMAPRGPIEENPHLFTGVTEQFECIRTLTWGGQHPACTKHKFREPTPELPE